MMDDWMNEKNIEKIIIRLRDLNNTENNDFIQNDLFQKNLPLFLNAIRELRQHGISVFESKNNLFNSLLPILAVEANIISIINVAVFEQFEENCEVNIYIDKNKLYAYDDYLNTISYYAKDLQNISFLAKFYVQYIDEKENVFYDK